MNKKWSFCIMCGNLNDNLIKSIDSIKKLYIPNDNYEIILGVDNYKIDLPYKNVIISNDKGRMWHTKKKNELIRNASFNNVCVFYDYITFDKDWYNNFLSFKIDWNTCSTPILYLNKNGRRDADWIITIEYEPWMHEIDATTFWHIPYNVNNLIHRQWLSGHYVCVKKNFIESNNLWFDESIVYGDKPAEDQEWSNRVKKYTTFDININSIAITLKDHPGHNLPTLTQEQINFMKL